MSMLFVLSTINSICRVYFLVEVVIIELLVPDVFNLPFIIRAYCLLQW
uniref:Uncharacterized protein n=1 Tax=Rhizophora mucronata TaxID=61149 RepID=A0A2P2MYD8_RHIMU